MINFQKCNNPILVYKLNPYEQSAIKQKKMKIILSKTPLVDVPLLGGFETIFWWHGRQDWASRRSKRGIYCKCETIIGFGVCAGSRLPRDEVGVRAWVGCCRCTSCRGGVRKRAGRIRRELRSEKKKSSVVALTSSTRYWSELMTVRGFRVLSRIPKTLTRETHRGCVSDIRWNAHKKEIASRKRRLIEPTQPDWANWARLRRGRRATVFEERRQMRKKKSPTNHDWGSLK